VAALEREARDELLEMDLREIREFVGKSQAEMAELLEKSQAEISRMERRGDYKLSTLKRVIAALGGELELVVKIGKRRLHLAA
jgi:predicted transcriptional regulator